MSVAEGSVKVYRERGWARVVFSHPKSNSLPSGLLRQLRLAFDEVGEDMAIKAVVLESDGSAAFCAGASFDELLTLRNRADADEYFSGFARVILAMKEFPKFVVARVHGKAVGGGLGLIAASDYSLASTDAAVRLSELSIGIAPFVIGPVLERRIGLSDFSAMAIDTGWRSAQWCHQCGLFTKIYESVNDLDAGIKELVARVQGFDLAAIRRLKGVLWEGTEHWKSLMFSRAAMSAELALSDSVQQRLAGFASKKNRV